MEIQRILAHAGLSDSNNQQIVSLLCLIMQTPWDGQHSCTDVSDCVLPTCTVCEFSLLCYQLSAKVLQFIAPATESPVPVQDVPNVDLLEARAKSSKSTEGKRRYFSLNLQLPTCHLCRHQANIFHVTKVCVKT